jgi:hypothetical protein
VFFPITYQENDGVLCRFFGMSKNRINYEYIANLYIP